MDFYETFDPAILLGDRLGLTLYGMFVESYLRGDFQRERGLYEKFVRHFPGERNEHSPEKFIQLIESVKSRGFDPYLPVYANPEEFSLVQGSHRSAIAIQMGVKTLPFNLRFQDDRTGDAIFLKIFSQTEVDLLFQKREEYIERCDQLTALWCRVRALMRGASDSFQAPFSSRTKSPTLRTYQGYEALGIKGKRPSGKRLEIYQLLDHLQPEVEGLEIGCNVGFFSLHLAAHLRSMDAFDIDGNYIALGNLVKKYRDIENVHLFRESVTNFQPQKSYGLVVCTAVHGWSGLQFASLVSLLEKSLLPGGILLFESHEIDAEKDWPEKRQSLLTRFRLVDSGLIDDVDKTMYASEMREFLILKR